VGEPKYLALQVQRLFDAAAVEQAKQQVISKEIRPMVKRWASELPTAALPKPEADIRSIRDAVRELGRRRTGAQVLNLDRLPKPDAPEEALRDGYKTWIELEQRRFVQGRLEPLGRLMAVPVTQVADPLNEDALVNALVENLLPSQYQSFASSNPLIALCATFEQEWRPNGYTRGELIKSLSLGPSDRLTIEIHTWDKSTRKTEQELSTESEMRTSEKMTQRDALTVAQEYSKQHSTQISASATVPIPKMPIQVSGNEADETRQSLKNTRESVREQTIEAANTLKVNRKMRIEESRETGREEKQTHVIENKNQCHSLNYHYFEVMANYLVTTRLLSVRSCVLLPNPRPAVTLDWVLCHEWVLIQVLLDKTFLPGFEAAKALKTQAILADLNTAAQRTQLEDLGQAVAPYVNAILFSAGLLAGAADTTTQAAAACPPTYAVFDEIMRVTCILGRVSDKDLARTTSWFSLEDAAHSALRALNTDINANMNHAEALAKFFAAASPQLFSEVVSADLLQAKLIQIVGLPPLLALSFSRKDLLSLDDAGLRAAINAAAQVAARPTPPSVGGGQDGASDQTAASNQEIAAATVEFNRLSCHIDENWLHYTQAVWSKESHGQRFLRLQAFGPIATVIENELLGFYGDRAAYPLRDRKPSVVTSIDLEKIISEATKEIEGQPDTTVLITQPTPGTVLEALVGKCDSCEDFIQQSRVIDLRVQEAAATLQESEARRYQERLSQDPPLLDDPSPNRGENELRIAVRVDKQELSSP
jgi:hypothetical protein